jgi:hypothetical protein
MYIVHIGVTEVKVSRLPVVGILSTGKLFLNFTVARNVVIISTGFINHHT